MLATIGSALIWGAIQLGPVMGPSGLQWLPTLLWGLGGLCALRVFADGLLIFAGLIEWFASRQPTGQNGTADWATWKILKPSLAKPGTGAFWGLLAKTRKALFFDFVSNAMVVAPAGSGKGIYAVIPAIFSITASKVIADFKGELACVCAPMLRKRGETVKVLNPAGLWPDQLGESDRYNGLHIIVDNLYRPGGLRDMPDDLAEFSKQVFPEPSAAEGENVYFRNGGRRAIADATAIEAMINGYLATVSAVALLVEDRSAFEMHMRWLVGIDAAGNPLEGGPMPIEQCEWADLHDPEDLREFILLMRARASNWIAMMSGADSRTFDSFASGAQQALAPFAYGRLAPAMGESTFSMDDLKDDRVSLFIISDASRPEVFKAYNGLMQWCAMTALKRHPKKEVPVYFILNEVTNYFVNGLASLLTWGRSFGLRLFIVFQDLSAFAKSYGEKELETLFSETEIKLFLPGQRSPKTLERIKGLLGNRSVASVSRSQDGLHSAVREQVSEQSRPLLDEDEIRRTERGLLIVRQNPPALIEPVAYAAIDPWRKEADINPFHGKPFLQRVKLRLRGARR
ncbi:MAG: type IV secretory system conjugative DNA transfer family protein [Pseudomonadota bacterium]